MLAHLETVWEQPDEGMWEVRGGRRHFTHSKVMAWVAFDRAVRSIQEFGLSGPADRWAALRDKIHAEVCHKGFDAELNAFVQSYGSKELEARGIVSARRRRQAFLVSLRWVAISFFQTLSRISGAARPWPVTRLNTRAVMIEVVQFIATKMSRYAPSCCVIQRVKLSHTAMPPLLTRLAGLPA